MSLQLRSLPTMFLRLAPISLSTFLDAINTPKEEWRFFSYKNSSPYFYSLKLSYVIETNFFEEDISMKFSIASWIALTLIWVFMCYSYVDIKNNLHRLKVEKGKQLYKVSSRYKRLYILSVVIQIVMPLIILTFLGLIYFGIVNHHAILNLNHNQMQSVIIISLFTLIGIVLGLAAELSGLLENLASQKESNR